MKYEIKNRWSGNVQFTAEIECDKDTSISIKLGLAIKVAIKEGANLSYADLRSANLRSANLRSANLSSADLSYADLSSADLSSANLSSADLRSANLRSADLSSADLSSANLSYADLRSANLRSANLRSANLRSADLRSADLRSVKAFGYTFNRSPIQISAEKYIIDLWDGFIKIGCEEHTYNDWINFNDEDITDMDGESALEWWNIWKPIIVNMAEKTERIQLPAQEEKEVA